MLTLRDVKADDVIELYVKDIPAATDGLLEEVIEEGMITEDTKTIRATVISFLPDGLCVLGWKENEERLFRAIMMPPAIRLPNVVWAYYVRVSALVRSINRTNAQSNQEMRCKRCNLPNPYAVTNRPDGTYVCYNCR